MVATEIRSDQLVLPDGVDWGQQLPEHVNLVNQRFAALREKLPQGSAAIPSAKLAAPAEFQWSGAGGHGDSYVEQARYLRAQQYGLGLQDYAVRARIFDAVDPLTAAAKFLDYSIFSFNSNAVDLANHAIAAVASRVASPDPTVVAQPPKLTPQMVAALTEALQGTVVEVMQVVYYAGMQSGQQAQNIAGQQQAGYQYMPGVGYVPRGYSPPGRNGDALSSEIQQIIWQKQQQQQQQALQQQQLQQQQAANAAAQQQRQQDVQNQGPEDRDEGPPPGDNLLKQLEEQQLLGSLSGPQQQQAQEPRHHRDKDDKSDDGKSNVADNSENPVQPGQDGAKPGTDGAKPGDKPGAPAVAGTLEMPGGGQVSVASLPESAQRAVLAAQRGDPPYPGTDLDKMARQDPTQLKTGSVVACGDPNDPKHAKQYLVVFDPKDGGTPCIVQPNNVVTPLQAFMQQNGNSFLGFFEPPGEGGAGSPPLAEGSPQPGGPPEPGTMDQPATAPVGREDRVVV